MAARYLQEQEAAFEALVAAEGRTAAEEERDSEERLAELRAGVKDLPAVVVREVLVGLCRVEGLAQGTRQAARTAKKSPTRFAQDWGMDWEEA